MRAREVDIPFSDGTGTGRIFVTDVIDSELVKITIDKTPRGQPFGVLTHASLTEAQAENCGTPWMRGCCATIRSNRCCRLSRRGRGVETVADLISVLVTDVRPIDADDGNLWELVVRDLATGVEGTMVVPDDDFRAMLGDCPTADLVNVDRDCITWKP